MTMRALGARQRVGRWTETLWWRRRDGDEPIARVAINMRPATASWGGGSQWAGQMARYLADRRYAVGFELDRPVDCVVLADPRPGGLVSFGADEVAQYKARTPRAWCLHRINENDQRKGTDVVDRLLAEANRVADHTVFISLWLRDYHATRWFDTKRPHSVITNGADPRVFHPLGGVPFEPGATLRLVTHHWSDNWRKGFAVYQEIDRLIADGVLANTELWVIGRWPKELRWRAARTFPPAHGEALARRLRSCHVYVTASLWEPGGMHFIEGAQCGLPALYHEDGGGIVEVAERFGIGFRDDVRGAVLAVRERYDELRRAVLERPPSGDAMCHAYAQLVQQGIALGRRAS